uniref:Integrin subunit alpha X n=1 Tax=Macaca fascicularis TaxID=9541 RepID=A0A7N9CHL3_MACFA
MTRTRAALLLFTALATSLGFNLDTEELTTFRVDSAGFGDSVVQYANSWVVVGAPQERTAANQTGGLYQCGYSTGACEPIGLQVPPEAVNMSLGLSLAATTSPPQLLACGPTVHHGCGRNMYLTGLCFLLAPTQLTRRLPASGQECPRQELDIVFLIDGSGSISSGNFAMMMNFVRAVINQFQRPSTQFSLMQFSSKFDIHFTFEEFRRTSNPLDLLASVHQLTGFTHTATAIQKVVRELFQASHGARGDATKILIVITDGRKEGDSLDYKDVIPMADAAGIIRYAIGVGSAFQNRNSWKELNDIASKPSQEHIFKVEDFDALKDIQNQLKEKIFAIEGTETTSSSSFELEMAQEGFSAVFTPDGPILGAVGSFTWSGGAFQYPPNMNPTFINMSQENVDMRDSYLGYSTELALWKGVQNLVLGAPRYQHTGKAAIFTQVSGQWRLKAEVTGTQIGSYFGASLCSVDVDGDGNTDLILIGAPHYYEQTRGGQVSVCPLPRGRVQWQCEAVLCGEQGHPWGRFGAALTVLGDVNGDKLSDVAIGAPGEQENRGAVYLFHGASESSISPSHSQRIAGSQLSPRLQYFGQALSGGQDLTQDGLMDLAVGARGQVLLLRSLPVLKVGVTMRFSPGEVAKSVYWCWEEGPSALEAGDATICLTIQKSSLDQLGDVQSSVRFDLALDPGRLTSRAIFDETKNPTLTRRKTLGLGVHCETLKLLLKDCVEDVLSPIILHLNFSLVREPISSPQNPRPVLAMGSQDLFTASLPFEKNCGQDGLCEGDLGVTLSFSGLKILTVGSSLELNVIVTVWNAGEDSYGTVVSLYYPAGLSHRRVLGAQKQPHQRALRLACETVPTEDEGLRSSRCSINHPIFHEGSNGTFIVTFDVSYKATLGDRMLMRASASSENNKASSSKATFQLELPVKYAVHTVISRQEESTKYFNFTTSDEKKMKEAEHRYRVNNLSQRDLSISINFWVPVLLNGVAMWDVVVEAPSQSLPCVSERKPPQHSDFLTQISRSPVLDCSIAGCLRFRCDIPSFSVQEQLDFTLKGNLSFGWVHQTSQKKVSVVSVAEITFDTSVYSQLPGQEAFMRTQMEMVLEEYEVYNAIPIIMGSSVGALLLLALITATLYKLGFFKRHYKEMLEDKLEETATFSGEGFSCGSPNVPLS